MNRRTRLILIAVAVLVAIAVPMGWSYYASQQVPEFYEVALQVKPQKQRVASTEMFNTTMALVQDVRRRGKWEAEFTQPQVNGWLAVDLVENHAQLLDQRVSNPRVSLKAGRATLAYRYESATISTVVSVAFDVYLAKPNVVAVRIVKVRAGALPVPLKNVLDAIAEAANEAGWQIEWRQQAGDPVALVNVPEIRDEDDKSKRLHLDEIEIRKGSVYLAGHTEVAKPLPSSDDHSRQLQLRVVEQAVDQIAEQSGAKSTRQR
jgi:hypothetical protein